MADEEVSSKVSESKSIREAFDRTVRHARDYPYVWSSYLIVFGKCIVVCFP